MNATSPFPSDAAILGGWIEEYRRYLHELGYRAKTLETYDKALRRMIPIFGKVATAEALLRRLEALSPATRALYVTIAKGFDTWCRDLGRIEAALFTRRLRRIQRDEVVPRPLAVDVLAKLDRASKELEQHGGRTRLLFVLLRTTGMRIGEVLALRRRHVILKKGHEGIVVETTKGRRDRFVPLLPGEALKLIRELPSDGDRCVLADAAGKPWSYQGARNAWLKLCHKAGIEAKATLHQLRHTRATELYRNGMSPEALQRAMGWANLEMVIRYVEVSDQDLRDELVRAERSRARSH